MVSQLSAAGGAPQPLWSGCCAQEAPGRGLLLYAKFEQPGIYARSLSRDALKNPEIRLVNDFVPLDAGFEVGSFFFWGPYPSVSATLGHGRLIFPCPIPFSI